MSKISVHYFNERGLGEAIRTLLAYGGEDFDDIRYTDEEWEKFQPSTPFGQLPLLVISGKIYSQSNAIARYLGRKYGLAGQDVDEEFEIDQNVDYFTELRTVSADSFYEEDPEIRSKLLEKLFKDKAPRMLTKLDEIISKNNGHIALGKLTWGDFVIAGVFDYIKYILNLPDIEAKYPSFKKLVDNVNSNPNVQIFSRTGTKI
ncbi:unnamed protein product [Pieris macdunnoughi]|uniref:glutathione transferase n=1 Tax=Pieris macdunnoughi TaxID=345717 RepID=A0A821WT21_9NEOP|nr:unnamed protein product [Pieris macdunnoughi]